MTIFQCLFSWGSWTRTNEYGNQNPMSYQLDDTPVNVVLHQGLEPWTRCLRGNCSNQTELMKLIFVSSARVELATHRLKVYCSTN